MFEVLRVVEIVLDYKFLNFILLDQVFLELLWLFGLFIVFCLFALFQVAWIFTIVPGVFEVLRVVVSSCGKVW